MLTLTLCGRLQGILGVRKRSAMSINALSYFRKPNGRHIVYQARDMHIMSAVNLSINGKHVWGSANRFAGIAGIPALRG